MPFRNAIFAAVAAMLLAGCSSSRPPVSLDLIHVQGGKPPMRSYLTRLHIQNTRDFPVWYVFPYWPDEAPDLIDGRFGRPNDPDHILEGSGYDGSKAGGQGRMVIVKDVGQFRAIHVPARSSMQFDNFSIDAMDPVEAIDVWEFESLKVNGRMPLERWFPYGTMSDANAHVTNERANFDWENLDWDYTTHATRTDLSKEKPAFIEAKILGKWKVPIRGASAANAGDPWK